MPPTEMLRNYAAEASDLLTRWRRGEDVQDALAHQLRHVSAGLNALQAEVVALREDKARLDWLFHLDTPALIEVPEKQDCITDRAGLDHYRKLHPSGLAAAVKQANPARDNKPEPQPGRTFA